MFGVVVEGLHRVGAGPLERAAVVGRSPAERVDVDNFVAEQDRLRLVRVEHHLATEQPHRCTFTLILSCSV